MFGVNLQYRFRNALINFVNEELSMSSKIQV